MSNSISYDYWTSLPEFDFSHSCKRCEGVGREIAPYGYEVYRTCPDCQGTGINNIHKYHEDYYFKKLLNMHNSLTEEPRKLLNKIMGVDE